MAFIGLDRKIVDHWIYQDAEYFKVWFEILYRARYSYEPEKKLIEGKLITIEYGQFIFGRVSWSERLKVSEQRLRTLLKKLANDDMIELIQKYPKFSLYSIKNYAKYNQQNNQQKSEEYQGIGDDVNQHSNSESTSSQPAANQQLTTQEQGSNKGNKGNKVYKDKKEYAEFVFLTETEHTKLTELLGDDERDRYFLRFASWISGKPPKERERRSAYLSILNWHREDQKKVTYMRSHNPSSYQKTKSKLQQMQEEAEARERHEQFGHHQTYPNPFG